MDLTEEKVYEALGVQPEPKGTGSGRPAGDMAGQPEEQPAPASQEENPAPAGEGERAPKGHELSVSGGAANGQPKQEPAEPAALQRKSARQTPPEGAGPVPESGAEELSGEEPREGDDGKGAEMPLEQRREAAAARRRAEQRAAIDEAVQKALREEKDRAKGEMAAFFKRAGLKNTITGEPITTIEEFEAWDKAYSEAKLQRDLKDGKLTAEDLEKVISENPAVKQAQELMRKHEEAERAAEAAAAKARVDAELLEIRKLDPAIQSMEDLLHMPTAREFYSLVRKGNSFLDAFRLANMDQLTARAAEAAKQQAQNLTRSKDHLTATGSQRGGGAVSVPADELRLFREINPGASEAEIQAYYNKYKGK